MGEQNRMRFSIHANFKSDVYSAEKCYEMTVLEYADVCEGETLTAREIECENAALLIGKGLVPFRTRSIAFIEEQLRQQFESMDSFTDYCNKNDIPYTELPLWVDTHSFNEYTGEHRGEYAPFDQKEKVKL